jgi:hypothetical protein
MHISPEGLKVTPRRPDDALHLPASSRLVTAEKSHHQTLAILAAIIQPPHS